MSNWSIIQVIGWLWWLEIKRKRDRPCLSRYCWSFEGTIYYLKPFDVFDRLYTAFPAVGIVVQGVATARFARTACIVFSSGLPLLQGLELIKQNVNNSGKE
jgi:hypothetical protein